jgi:hypothetical protein
MVQVIKKAKAESPAVQKKVEEPDLQVIAFDEEKGLQMALVPIDLIIPNEYNPNEMEDTVFNELVSDISEDGFLQTITIVPVIVDGRRMFRVVDGEHRYEAAKLSDAEVVPSIIATKGRLATEEDVQKFKTMRMNVIRGRPGQAKLRALVEDLAQRHPLDKIAEQFLYDDPDELAQLIGQARKELPSPDMQKEFDKAKDQIKTVEDLSGVLNRLFTKYGETVPYHYMVVDWGGKQHLWVRLEKQTTFTKLKKLADMCKEKGVRFDTVVSDVLLSTITEDFLNKNAERFPGPDES